MSSSFFLPSSRHENKIGQGATKKRKFEGHKKVFSKPKVKKKFMVGGKKQRKNEDTSENLKANKNEEILSDASDVEGREVDENEGAGSDASDEETAEEKRLRLAKKYLEEIERQEKERIGELPLDQSKEPDSENTGLEKAVNLRLRRDDLEESGKLTRIIAPNYENLDLSELVDITKVRLLRDHKVHKSSITCVVASSDGKYVLSGSKDGGLVLWGIQIKNANSTCVDSQIGIHSRTSSNGVEIDTGPTEDLLHKLARVAGGRKGCEEKHVGHCSSVNCVAISTDSKFLASGDDSNLIIIWKIDLIDNEGNGHQKEILSQRNLSSALQKIHTFRGHRSPVSGLAFRMGTHTLYSCSHDRSVKVWNLDEMSYVETLFGHQDRLTGIDAGIRERVLTSGGRDGTVRIWKIVEESQLVFNAPGTGGSGSVDSVKLLDEQHFVTCGEDGHLSLWGAMKKKPVFTVAEAHGKDPTNQQPRWISAITTMHNTDLVASGSSDGVVKLWKCVDKFRSMVEIASLPISNYISNLKQEKPTDTEFDPLLMGFVNGLCFHPSGRALLVGVGQEHRLGRWWRFKEARNGILVIPLCPRNEPESDNAAVGL